MEDKKKLLIKPDFMTNDQGNKEKLCDDKTLHETECPTKKSVRPLIEVISESPAIFEHSEDISEQKKEIEGKSHDRQVVASHCEKDVSMSKNEKK